MAKLIYQDPDSGQEVSVEIGPDLSEVTIGRNPGNIVRINNPSISRKHAKLVFDGGRVTLYDLNSSNGSYVNGSRIQNQALVDGDRIRVGEFPLDFVETAGAEPPVLDVEPYEEPQGGFESEPPSSPGVGQQAGSGLAESTSFGKESRPETGAAQAPPSPPSQADHGRFGPPEDVAAQEDYDEPMMLDDADFEEVGGQVVAGALADADSAASFAENGLSSLEAQSSPPPYHDENPDVVAEPDEHIEEMYSDTTSAPPEQIAAGLAQAGLDPTSEAGFDEVGLDEVRLDELHIEQAEFDELRAENDELRRRLAQLEQAPDPEELSALEGQLNEAREELDALHIELDGARADIEQRDDTILTLQAQRDQLEQELGEVQQRYEATEQQKLEAAEQSSQLAEQLSQAQEELEGFEARYREAEEQRADLEERLAGLEEERDALQDALAERNETVDAQQERIAHLEADQRKKKQIFEELSGDLRALVRKKGELEARIDELEAELNRQAG